jgi:peptidoglycan hydrolase CwlO-like protein
MKKYKMTGCARFVVALIIIAPLAYLGAAYYNGENGIENIKNFFGIGKQDDSSDTYQDTSLDLRKELSEKEDEIKRLEKENAELKNENATLKEQLEKGRE